MTARPGASTTPSAVGPPVAMRVRPMLARRLEAVVTRQATPVLGFPAATDIDFSPLAHLTCEGLNNVGDPTVSGLGSRNVKDLEREVIEILAGLFAAPDDRWGYTTSGSTEAILFGLYVARTLHPRAVVYARRRRRTTASRRRHCSSGCHWCKCPPTRGVRWTIGRSVPHSPAVGAGLPSSWPRSARR
jgi:hypothetical protein